MVLTEISNPGLLLMPVITMAAAKMVRNGSCTCTYWCTSVYRTSLSREGGLFHGIQRQETIKCLLNWGFTSEQIAQYMSGGSDKTSSTIVLRESGGESSTGSTGSACTVEVSGDGTTEDGPSVGNGSSIRDSFSVGPSIADHSSALNRSTPIFGTTMVERQRDGNDRKGINVCVCSWYKCACVCTWYKCVCMCMV